MAKRHSHKYQALAALRPYLALGTPRHGRRHDGLIHSRGTHRNYIQALRGVSRWLRASFGLELADLDERLAYLYLEERAGVAGQKTIDLDRQALQVLLGKLTVIRATDPRNELASRHRAYTAQQVEMLVRLADAPLRLPIRLGWEAGIRAEELLTLRRREERPPSRRSWGRERFALIGDCHIYTVRGKGGLVREVALSPSTARELEEHRRPLPTVVRDREILIESYYDMPGGQQVSQAFGDLSRRVFGWSNGFHGLRHAYAQRRVAQLIEGGHTFARAREIGSQELGHFDPKSMNYYLR